MLETFSKLAVKEPDLIRLVLQATWLRWLTCRVWKRLMLS